MSEGFNPDKYLEKKQAQGFDPDAYLASKQQPKEEEAPSALKSALLGGLSGLSLGGFDELAGGVEAARQAALKGSLSDIGDDYSKARDQMRAILKSSEESHPIISTASKLAGGLIPAAATGGSSLLGSIAGGAGYGAASALGESEASGTDLLKDIGTGGAIGAAAGGIGSSLGKLLSKLAKPAQETAQEAAASSLGLTKATAKKMGPEKIRELGQYALENDLVSANPFKSAESIAAANETVQNQAGQLIGDTLKKLPQGGIDTNQIAMDVVSQLENKFPGQINKSIKPFIGDIGADILNTPNTLEGLQATKGSISQAANWGSLAPSDKSTAAQSAYGLLKENIENAISKAGDKIQDPELIQKFLQAKKDYGNAATADMLLGNKIASDMSKGALSATDKIAGIAGAMKGGGVGSLIGAGVNKLVTGIAKPAVAKIAQATASGLESAASKTPAATMTLSRNLYKMNNQDLAQVTQHLQSNPSTKMYADVLNDAMANGNEQRKNAALFSMMQNPAAREQLNSLNTEDKGDEDVSE